MPRISTLLMTALVAAACTTPAHTAENLAARIAAAPDGTVAFSFPARAGVCGDGASLIVEVQGPNEQTIYTANGTSIYNNSGRGGDLGSTCIEGPVRVVLDVRNGKVLDIHPYVGKAGRAVRTELGLVNTPEATDYLIGLGGSSADLAADAFLAASLGEGSRISVPLVKYAGDRGAAAAVRESAVKWIGRTAERESTVPEVLPALRSITLDRGDEAEVRERSLRAIGQFSRGDQEIRAMYAKIDVANLRERALRIFAEVGGSENYQFIRAAAVNQQEDASVRERAIRALGDGGHTEQLRSLYSQIGDADLKERIVRVIGDHGSNEDRAWIETIAVNPREDSALRERAIRELAEHGMNSVRLAALYDDMSEPHLKERVLRLLGERADDAAVEKLVNVARGNDNQDLRRRAARILAESDHPRAREFIRSTVLR